ncbi:HAD-IC family P-type ATPase [Bdellovibrionota bacterium FG-1]
MALSNDAERDHGGKINGDPTEVALYRDAARAGFEKATLVTQFPRVKELPFDSERKCMTTLHKKQGGWVAFTKGAPEKVLAACENVLTSSGLAPLPRGGLEKEMERMAADGLRVLAIALNGADPAKLEIGLTFIGFVGLLDPPRPEAAAAIASCRTAGITPVMITGDHPATAQAIASRIGIGHEDFEVLAGGELAKLIEAEFEERVEHVRVYARMSPEQKIRIVTALQKRGECVAMTGDGVNDAPALKKADIGVAMGQKGTEVAREASQMILLDDNFATIVGAVRERRRIYDNIRKFVKFVMTGNLGEILTIFVAPFLGLPIPLLPIQILWINLVTDGLPGLALAVEPEEKRLMQVPPRPLRQSVFAGGLWQHILWAGMWIGAVSLLAQIWAIHTGSMHGSTMVFTVLALTQMSHVLAIRSESESTFSQGFFSNRWVLGAVVLTLVLQLAIIYVPVLNSVFKTQALSLRELVLCLGLSSTIFFAVEIEKTMRRKGLQVNSI